MLLRWSGRALLALLILGLAGVATEIAVRAIGRSPAQATLGLITEPRDAHMYRQDALLGYALVPDRQIRITHTKPLRGRSNPPVQQETTFTWISTVNSEGHRITHPPLQAASQATGTSTKPELWLFGCSFTFGWSVDDDQTSPWRLQNSLPNLEVVNFGVPGYSTFQSLMQFEEALKKGKPPELAVLVYYDFHQERNTLSPSYRRVNGFAWTAWGERDQPYLVWRDGQMERHRGPMTYEPNVPFIRYSAYMNYLDELIVRKQDGIAAEHDHRREVTERLIEDFATLARKHGTRFLLIHPVFSGSQSEMTRFSDEHGISAHSVVLPSFEDWNSAGMSNQPYDNHPSAKGQALLTALFLPVIEWTLAARTQ